MRTITTINAKRISKHNSVKCSPGC